MLIICSYFRHLLRKLQKKFKRKRKRNYSWHWRYHCHKKRLPKMYVYSNALATIILHY